MVNDEGWLMTDEAQIADSLTVDDDSALATDAAANIGTSLDSSPQIATDTPRRAPDYPEDDSGKVPTDEHAEQPQQTEEDSQFQAEIRDALIGLRRDFESKLMYDESKQRQLDVLHAELETYRRGFHFQLLRPIITDLISLYNDMDRVFARLAGHELSTPVAHEVAQFRDQVEEILRRNGVERFTTPGEEFDAKRQRVVAFVETTDPTLDKHVAEHLRPGVEYEGKIVTQPEQVSAYRFVAAPTEEPD